MNISLYGVFGICFQTVNYQCLNILIRQNDFSYYLYIGFWLADCLGATTLTINKWIHAAFTFDITTLEEKVYLNEILENTCNIRSTLSLITTTTIGSIPKLNTYSTDASFQVKYYLK